MAKKSKNGRLKVAISTCGGDCPGLNSAIEAAVRFGTHKGFEMVGIRDGMSGFTANSNSVIPLTEDVIRGKMHLGGTFLGTSNKGSPFRDPKSKAAAIKEISDTWKKNQLDAMMVIGGDGSHIMMKELVAAGLNIVGIPKTIDNDLSGSDTTIGFSTAVDTATAAAMSLRNSADSHSRIMILEVMGRDSGHIALSSGLAAGADCIFVPEIPFDLAIVVQHFKARAAIQRNSYLIVAAEGATPGGMNQMYKQATSGSLVLGGIGNFITDHLFSQTGVDVRNTVLGHVQRGGFPNPTDKILAARFATYAMDLIETKNYGQIVGIKRGELYHFPYEKLKSERYKIPKNSDLLRAAESMGICFGREN